MRYFRYIIHISISEGMFCGHFWVANLSLIHPYYSPIEIQLLILSSIP